MAAITDPNDPRLSDPAYASDPDVLAYLNGIYGPGGTVGVTPTGQTAPPNDATWNAGTQAYNPTGPVTDPNDPRLSDPAHGTDPDVLAYLNGIYGPGGTVYNPPAGNTGWNPQTQDWNTPVTGGGPAPGPTPPPTGNPPPTTAAPPTSGSPYFGTNIGDFTAPFTEKFDAPTPEGIPDAPVFNAPSYTPPPSFEAPTYTTPPAFTAPTAEQAGQDQGYQFTLGQGLGALLNSRAAGGMLNSGATGKALVDYGQAAGATQYGNVYNRAADIYNTNVKTQYQDPYQQAFTKAVTDYNTNYKTQYQDPYQNAFQNAQAEFAPKLTAWQTSAPMIQSQNNQNYQNAFNKWLTDYNMYTGQQDRAFNKFNTVLGS